MLEQILIKAASFAIGFIIGSAIMLLVSALWNLYMSHVEKKRVLKAVKELGIEDELAENVAGCNARCLLAIEQYFITHRWGTPFVGGLGTFKLCYLLSELRKENRIKQVANGGK